MGQVDRAPSHAATPNRSPPSSAPFRIMCMASDRSPRRVEFTKALLRLYASFDRSMILLQDVVQVLDRPVAATASQDFLPFSLLKSPPRRDVLGRC